MSKIFVDQVDPKTATTLTLGTSGDTVSIPSGVTIANAGTATGFGITAASFLPTASPIFYNADMQVSQRATTKTGITGSGYYVVDRMKVVGSLGTWTDIQETLTTGAAFNAGFQKAYRMDCTTAAASPSAGSAKIFTQYFEGQDLGMFKKGTPNAETSTLAFWVKSNKTGTYQVNMLDKDNTRMCGASYTISVADTWEHKICNYAADTTGDYNHDNGRSLDIEWWLGSGTDFSSGTMPTAWEAEASADSNAAATVNVGDNTANDWAITGIQFEVGTYTSANLPPFRWETYGGNLERCQRYFFKSAIQGEAVLGSGLGNITNGHECSDWTCALPVTMRALGTVTIYDSTATTNKLNYYSGGWQSGGTVNGANMQGDTMIHVGSAQDTWNADLYIEAEL